MKNLIITLIFIPFVFFTDHSAQNSKTLKGCLRQSLHSNSLYAKVQLERNRCFLSSNDQNFLSFACLHFSCFLFQLHLQRALIKKLVASAGLLLAFVVTGLNTWPQIAPNLVAFALAVSGFEKRKFLFNFFYKLRRNILLLRDFYQIVEVMSHNSASDTFK